MDNNKKAFRSNIISLVLLLVSIAATIYLSVSNYIPAGTGTLDGRSFDYGFAATINYYFNIWRPVLFPLGLAFVALVIILIAIVLTLILVVAALVKKKPVLAISALLLGASIAYIPFILMLVVPMIEMQVLRILPFNLMAGIFGLTLFSIYFAYAPVSPLIKCMTNGIKKFAGAQKKCNQDKPVPAGPELSEEVVREIFQELLAAHLNEKHTEAPAEEPVVAQAETQLDESVEVPVVETPVEIPADITAGIPTDMPIGKILIIEKRIQGVTAGGIPYEKIIVVEKPVEQQPAVEKPLEKKLVEQPQVAVQPVEPLPVEERWVMEKPVEQPAVEMKLAEKVAKEEEKIPEENIIPLPQTLDNLSVKGKKRRPSFETLLKNSDFDVRHKYYDLRDYIKWYGLSNRLSIPGDTFSLNRQRYAFITIVGKHIRLYLSLDPAAYAETKIPVEKVEGKKYEEVPCLIRIKSDLSYRRAKKLIDDLAVKMGIPKPFKDAPKETQQS